MKEPVYIVAVVQDEEKAEIAISSITTLAAGKAAVSALDAHSRAQFTATSHPNHNLLNKIHATFVLRWVCRTATISSGYMIFRWS